MVALEPIFAQLGLLILMADIGFVYLVGRTICRRTIMGRYGKIGQIGALIPGAILIICLILLSPGFPPIARGISLVFNFAVILLGFYGWRKWIRGYLETGHWYQ
jgi:hypothetical protein